MSEGERQALALRLYDDWQKTDTADSLEIYCYDKGRADAIDEFLKKDKECQQKHEECPYMYSEIDCVECIAEQLKEQN